ncbi:stress response translation initiation inhibitor YciH [Halorarum salinum]|uniref:Stress response translation initiation inhibitor YciH n=1 Tax=Halorarum salinum TaxID=2743089 RepID=A0A7D5QC65_9EURY|nr:stress response translation initiation inhibitor YciH [Halobaculum salinum]QLG63118.1 stress response translation initiation inhibitor YciH [Halobaculum salinum]
MSDDDPFADLPDDLTEDLARAEQRLTVRIERRTYNKPVTIVEGFDDDSTDLKGLASELKRSLGTGGTVDDGAIELQGDHSDRVRDLLRDRGFSVGDA